MARKKNSLRIIGGDWRSRRVQFAEVAGIRPTPDRVRETLFNWLSTRIIGARCLDLFAGSGALGFEAASRGANPVLLVDHNKAVTETLTQQKQALNAHQVQVIRQDALAFLQQTEQLFDTIFLDPPFNTDLLQQALSVLVTRALIAPSALLYTEFPVQSERPQCLNDFRCIHEKTAGQVRYGLYQGITQENERQIALK